MFILPKENPFNTHSQDAGKEVLKLEKEIKPEKREKTKKYTNSQKQLKNRQIRHEDTHNLAIKVDFFCEKMFIFYLIYRHNWSMFSALKLQMLQ